MLSSYVVMAAGMLFYWIALFVVVDAAYLVILLGVLGSVFGHVLLGIGRSGAASVPA